MTATTPCAVCTAAEREPVFRAMIRGKHDVQYWYCAECGTLQTEAPYWLPETYAIECGEPDTDQAARNLYCARRLAGLLYFIFDRNGKHLDYAGGYGLLTRLMRDIGFDYHWWDPYTRNLFAEGFEASEEQPFDVVTAFEVLEHVTDPVGFVADLRRRYKMNALVFSTQLFSGRPPQPAKWSYYALRGGQHVSFYQARSLERIAQRVGGTFYSDGRTHLISWRPVKRRLFKLLTSNAAGLVEPFVRKRMQSRTASDQALLAAREAPGA